MTLTLPISPLAKILWKRRRVLTFWVNQVHIQKQHAVEGRRQQDRYCANKPDLEHETLETLGMASRLKKSPEVKLRSKLSHTLYHLSVATLYVCHFIYVHVHIRLKVKSYIHFRLLHKIYAKPSHWFITIQDTRRRWCPRTGEGQWLMIWKQLSRVHLVGNMPSLNLQKKPASSRHENIFRFILGQG